MPPPPPAPASARRTPAVARIRRPAGGGADLARDFGSILGYVDRLRARDEADGVEPLVHAVPPEEPAASLRADVPAGGPAAPLPFEQVAALAPDVEGRHLRVPRVLEEGR